MGADIKDFGMTANGQRVQAVTLRTGALQAVVLTLGAALQDVRLAGFEWPLTLGCADIAAYAGPAKYFGTLVGPVANRIGGAKADIDGKTCRFDANEGTTVLHSGASGIHGQTWTITEAGADFLRLQLALADGLGGFPGNRMITAEYRLSAPARLSLHLEAQSDATTLMNLANHSYWSLDGAGSIAGQHLHVNADSYLPTDHATLPTGEQRPVTGKFDLRRGRMLDLSEGYDHNFCLATQPRALTEVARLTGRAGLRMTLHTTAPGLQIYDGAGLASAPFPGHHGQPYRAHEGIAFEAQLWPDAPNHAAFPSITLTPAQTYRQTTVHDFTRV